jgi:hypothetical protein
MKFEMSDYIALHSDNVGQASEYYEKVFGLKVKGQEKGVNFIDAKPFTICMTQGDVTGVAMEFVVDDAKSAEDWLLKNGCKIRSKYDDGRPRYFEDKYGLIFHLWEKKK